MPSLFAHWKMIPRSCIYLEMCRDDTYFKEAADLIDKARKTEGTSYLSGGELFHSVLDFIGFALREEMQLWIAACTSEDMESVQRTFGTNSVSAMMLRGLVRSLRRYYRLPPRGGVTASAIPDTVLERYRALRSECNGFFTQWVIARPR